MEKIAYYCQKCRAANETGDGNCWRCGTRLMLLVFPPSLRHEEGMPPSFYEDHLLERVSLLELHLSQVMEQLKMAYEFMQKEASTLHKDHLFLQAFFETIKRVNPDFAKQLNQEFSEIYNEQTSKVSKKNKKEQELKEILAEHGNNKAELFTHLVKEGIRLFEENEEKQAFRTLERASLLSPKNIPLSVFIAKKLFLAEKFETAKDYLEKAFEVDSQNLQVLLLLGFVYANELRSEDARKLLGILANNPQTTNCVNTIWGMMAASEENWSEALAAFKEALAESESSEIYYLIGCANFQLQKYEIALKHLERSVKIDEKNADAWFMQSVIYNVLGEDGKAKETMKAAFDAKEAGAKCLEFMKKKNRMVLRTALPFRHFRKPNKKLLTNGSPRMRKFFREQIFNSIK